VPGERVPPQRWIPQADLVVSAYEPSLMLFSAVAGLERRGPRLDRHDGHRLPLVLRVLGEE